MHTYLCLAAGATSLDKHAKPTLASADPAEGVGVAAKCDNAWPWSSLADTFLTYASLAGIWTLTSKRLLHMHMSMHSRCSSSLVSAEALCFQHYPSD